MVRVFLFLLFFSLPSMALEPGKPAPAFSGKTSQGKRVKLSDYLGKVVVLEWLNYGCPFVQKHYDGKNMQALQKEYTGKGVVWLSVISSAEGKQGYSSPERAEKDRKEQGSEASAVILDPSGEIGRLYGAQTTPHMFVINSKGQLSYQGAIDNKASTDPATLKGAHSYVRDALDAVLSGRAPAVAQTKSHGCSVKY